MKRSKQSKGAIPGSSLDASLPTIEQALLEDSSTRDESLPNIAVPSAKRRKKGRGSIANMLGEVFSNAVTYKDPIKKPKNKRKNQKVSS